MSKGANNLLLVSRNATKHPNAAKIYEQGFELGCKIHIRDCDLTNEGSLVELLAECSRSMPPIRGLVNCAMVLDDTVFEHMKYEQWCNGIRSKIDTSRNLDKHLPRNISFFIMLSSGLVSNKLSFPRIIFQTMLTFCFSGRNRRIFPSQLLSW